MRIVSTANGGGNGSGEINLIRNSEVIDRAFETSSFSLTGTRTKPLWWELEGSPTAVRAYHSHAQIFTVADSGPDAGVGSTWTTGTGSYVCLKRKVSGDGETALWLMQYDGAQVASGSGTLTKQSGSGDATISYTAITGTGETSSADADYEFFGPKFGVATASTDEGVKQTFRFRDEPLLSPGGQVSASVEVWCTAGTITLSVEGDDSAASSDSTTTTGGWVSLSLTHTASGDDSQLTWTLTNSADSHFDFRKPVMCVGTSVIDWRPRLVVKGSADATAEMLPATNYGDVLGALWDFSAFLSPNAVAVDLVVQTREPSATGASQLRTSHGWIEDDGAGYGVIGVTYSQIPGGSTVFGRSGHHILSDDKEIFYEISEGNSGSDILVRVTLAAQYVYEGARL